MGNKPRNSARPHPFHDQSPPRHVASALRYNALWLPQQGTREDDRPVQTTKTHHGRKPDSPTSIHAVAALSHDAGADGMAELNLDGWEDDEEEEWNCYRRTGDVSASFLARHGC